MSQTQRETIITALRSRGVRSGTVAERRAQFDARIQPDDSAGLTEAEVTLGGMPEPSCAKTTISITRR